MHKRLAILSFLLVGISVFLVSGCTATPTETDQPMEHEEEPTDTEAPMGTSATTMGTIVSVDTELAMVDGPYLITIRTDEGSEQKIAVPSMGILLCDAHDAIADIGTLQSGMTIEVSGTVDSDGRIVPCEDTTHYLRVVGQ